MKNFLSEGKLDNQEIRKALLEHKYYSGFKPSETLINNILDQFWFHDFYNSFISDRIFLDYLKKYLDQTKPKSLNRFDFYQFLFDQIAKGEQRSTLQLIGISFEQAQTDSIEQSSYEKLLVKLRVPKSLFTTTWMQDKHLVKIEEKEGKQYVILQHHTLTEFLVAEYIITQKAPLKEFQSLAVLDQEGVTALKPSWYGVLRFLLESEKGKEFLGWLLSFLDNNPDNLDDQIAELLTFVNLDVSPETKKRIFNLIYKSYSQRLVWLPVWARGRLSKFVDKEIYSQLKDDLKKWSNETETFTRRGNVVFIIDGLLEKKNPIITPFERKFWRGKLVDFAKDPNENGVLQRHSLHALSHFKDKKIISLVAKSNFEDTQDTLRKDAFLQFCADSAPDSQEAINFFIEGVKRGSDIYARHGLFQINRPRSINYFLSKTVDDKRFWEQFLHHESIFSAEKNKGDQILIENIEKSANSLLIQNLKKIIQLVFEDTNFYHEARSSFIRRVAAIIQKYDPNYIVELVDHIKSVGDTDKIDELIFEYEDLISILLTEKNVETVFKTIKDFPSARLRPEAIVYVARRENGDIGRKVYEKAVGLKLIPPAPKDTSRSFEEQEKDRKKKIHENFLTQLQPEPGKYKPSVFEYFLQNRKEIEEHWKSEDKNRLLKLAFDEGLKKIDPKQFKVTIKDKKAKSFSWTSIASYYGDILAVVNTLAPEEIPKYRQNIIDFIPYAFTEDMSRILELAPDVKDKELSFVNKVMANKKNDRRYLVPDSYTYIVGQYAKRGCNLPSVKSILKSFIEDKEMEGHIRKNALETLGLYINRNDQETKTLLQKIFDEEKDTELKKIANSHRSLYRNFLSPLPFRTTNLTFLLRRSLKPNLQVVLMV